ncbi:hypothetical protein D1816_01105 [Aquimarina sp. AD10]|uniref:Carboxymuconolactone decarboxylase-like domain-containing protein n=1 Tax=Aquimarina aggregata TaxID=1642818 RepID=A0A163BMU9_9FLAO|nr:MULTISPECIES: hypothetical protein [Aquimarina]AXT59005.1 hypothetical protein D1816_01105 [Aquimarina sp. AD10]KZS41562.1 hypothetical protein AWE51_21385 [Aquimarina aggregata]RKM95100.1 hypothetical protein D7033_17570 [Aquimarina sp. AD10]
MIYTLAQQLEPLAIDFEVLQKKYSPMLSLVNELIGVIPNADPIMEIWPTGFRTYNLLVPNLLNLPHSLWKNKPLKALKGLAMYTSSRVAECQYCSAHTCSFALRRGLDPEVISGKRKYTVLENAIVELAKGISEVPVKITKKELILLNTHISKEEIEEIVLSVALMGFLNKFMDAVGIELENSSLKDVGKLLSATGWHPGKHRRDEIDFDGLISSPIQKDNFWTYLRILKFAPKAVLLEKKWTKGVPDNYTQSALYLKKHTGYTFPILEKIKSKRVIKALTTVLKDNLDPVKSELGIRVKYLTSLVYFITINNITLAKEAEVIVTRLTPEIGLMTLDKVKNIAKQCTPKESKVCKSILSDFEENTCLTKEEAAAVILAKAMSTSPAEVNKTILIEITPYMKPESAIELGIWISIQQLFHRLQTYYQII